MQTLSGVHIRIPPVASEDRALFWMGPPEIPDATKVYVWADALHELIRAATHRPTVMQTALLLGSLCAGPGERFVEVRGYMDLHRYDDVREFAQNINDEWTSLNNRARRNGDGLSIVGWASLRENESPLGRDLQMAHRSFFNLPYQIMFTIDPQTEEVALYGFDEIGHLVQVGFQLVVDR